MNNSVELEKELKEAKKTNASLKKKMKEQETSFEQQLKAIQEQLSSLMNVGSQSPSATLETTYEISNDLEEINIRPDKYITVMSLLPQTLILKGNGKIYKFKSYGEIHRIVYGDVMDIIHNHSELAKNGGFYILDENVVAVQGLKEAYNDILNKKALDELITKNVAQFESIFVSLSTLQKNTIAQNIVKAIVSGQDISINIVNIVNKHCKINIDNMVNDYMTYDEVVKDMEAKR